MSTVKLLDAKKASKSPVWHQWIWSDLKLEVRQDGQVFNKTFLFYRGLYVHDWDALVTPEEVWDEMSGIMLNHGLLLEPLHKSNDMLDMPDMEGPCTI